LERSCRSGRLLSPVADVSDPNFGGQHRLPWTELTMCFSLEVLLP
jgi:hypothetical protein